MRLPPHSIYQRWCRDQRGTIAIIFAMTLTMGIGITGAAIDYARALGAQTEMQSAADAAATSAASLTSGTSDQKIALATNLFNRNYNTGAHVSATPTVTVSGDNVTVSATATVPTTFAAVIGVSTVPIAGSATATMAWQGDAICMRALDQSGAKGVDI